MISGNLQIKHPEDAVLYQIDFSSLLAVGETIVTKTVVSTPSDMIPGAPSVSGGLIQFQLTGGTVGTFYSVRTTAVTSNGNTFSDCAMILCQECNWLYEFTRIIRYLSGDVVSPPSTTDANIGEISLIASLAILAECTFSNTYSVSVGTFSLSPDPTNPNTRDNAFINLVTLKSACLLDLASLRNKAGLDGITVRDGMGSIQTNNSTQGYKTLLGEGPCGQYKEALKQYKFSGIFNFNPMMIASALNGPSVSLPYSWGGADYGGFGGRAFRSYGFF